jgi:hypothetical protein
MTEGDAGDWSRGARLRWRIKLYPLGIPVSFVLIAWSTAVVDPVWLLRPLIVIVAAVSVANLGLSTLLRDGDRGALATWLLTLALLINDLRVTAILGLAAIALVIRGLVVRRAIRFGATASSFLTLANAAIVLVTLASLAQKGTLGDAVEEAGLSRPAATEAARADATNHDIYIVLLDGYPGDDAAEIAESFDPDAFPQALEARGFVVQRHSRSNYLSTSLALASFFEGRHIADIESLRPLAETPADTERRLRLATGSGAMLGAFENLGYESVLVHPGWVQLGPRRGDRVVDLPQITEFERILLRVTSVGEIADAVDPGFIGRQTRDRIEQTYRTLEELPDANRSAPCFCFVHVPAPHFPVVYTATGGTVEGGAGNSIEGPFRSELGRRDHINRTFGQVEYISGRTIQAIDALIARATRPTTVVVWSDHGTGIGFDDSNPLASDLNERSSSFLAVRSADGAAMFRPGTTPVNVLSQILNQQFAAGLPLQPDSTWAWRERSSLLDLVAVDPRLFDEASGHAQESP